MVLTVYTKKETALIFGSLKYFIGKVNAELVTVMDQAVLHVKSLKVCHLLPLQKHPLPILTQESSWTIVFLSKW